MSDYHRPTHHSTGLSPCRGRKTSSQFSTIFPSSPISFPISSRPDGSPNGVLTLSSLRRPGGGRQRLVSPYGAVIRLLPDAKTGAALGKPPETVGAMARELPGFGVEAGRRRR